MFAVATHRENETRDQVRAFSDRGSNELAAVSTLLTDRAVVVSGLLAASSRRADTDQAAGDVATLTDAWSITARRVDALERMDARIREIDRIELDRVERAVVDDLVSARHPRAAAQ